MIHSAQVLIREGAVGASSRWRRSSTRRGSRRPVDIAAITHETEHAVTLQLRPADGRPLDFIAGQYLTLYADIDGRQLKRAYSLSVPQHSPWPAVTIKTVEGGVFSHWALQHARKGQRLHIAGPSGEFTLPSDATATACVFAAAGSGVTPVISLIETLLQAQPRARVALVYGNREEADIIFRERLDQLAAKHANFSLHYTLTRPRRGWHGGEGHISVDSLLAATAGAEDAHYFVCGPGDCVTSIGNGLRAAGVQAARIHGERFTAGVEAVTAHPTEPHPVRFLQTGREIIVRPGESILEAGLRGGMDLPFSCTMGGCGHCKMQKRSGSIIMDEPNCLSDSESLQGYFLACCAYPIESLEVAG